MNSTLKSIFWLACLALLLSLFTALPGMAAKVQSLGDSLESAFSEAVSQYQGGNYEVAASAFAKLSTIKPPHPWSGPAMVMEAQALYSQERYYQVLGILQEFLRAYPKSNYVPYARYLQGNVYYKLGNGDQALREFLFVCDESSSSEIKDRACSKALNLVSPKINFEYLDVLGSQFSGELARDVIAARRADILSDQSQFQKAQGIITPLLAKNVPPGLSNYLAQLKQYLDNAKNQDRVIGIISNFSSQDEEREKQFFNGFWFAIKKYNKSAENPLKIAARDAEGNMIKAITLTKDLGKYPNVIAMVGPLSNDLAICSALEAEHARVPMIVPTAQEAGIAAIGPWIFQATSDYSAHASAISRFATQNLNLSTFATLAPIDEAARELSKAFGKTVVEGKRKILGQEWYYPGTIDFNRQFTNLRKESRDYGYQRNGNAGGAVSSVDSLESAYFANKETSMPSVADSQKTSERVERLDVAEHSLDAIYLPIHTEDIKYIAPQLAVYNLRTQLLGSSAWYDATSLANQENYVNGIYFTTNYILNEYDLSYVNFRNEFRQEMQTTPGAMEVRGFDTGNLLISAIKNGASSRESVRNELAQIRDFQGVGCRVQFDSSGANTWVPILRYESGAIKFIQ